MNVSFDEAFCDYLEFHLTRTFQNSGKSEIGSFWCDGVSHEPYFGNNKTREYLSIANIARTKEIKTTAWLGKSGQEEYNLNILLGPESVKAYMKGEGLIQHLPSDKSMDWVQLNIESKSIEIKLA